MDTPDDELTAKLRTASDGHTGRRIALTTDPGGFEDEQVDQRAAVIRRLEPLQRSSRR